MAGFKLRGHLLGASNPVTTTMVIANSQTVTVGDAVKSSSGYAAVCDANDRILGFVQAIVDANGVDLDNANPSNFDGVYTQSTQTYVASGDNATDKKVSVKIIADPYALMYNETDDDLTEAMHMQFFSLVDEDQVDGGSNSATVGELQLWKLDPDGDGDASKGLFRIVSWLGDSFEPET